MKPFYVLLAWLMIVRNAKRVRKTDETHRWFALAFWICFGALSLLERSTSGVMLCSICLLSWLLARFWKWLYILGLFGPRWVRWYVLPPLRRFLAWLLCSLRGQPLFIIYTDQPPLARLIETALLPRVAHRAVVIRKEALPGDHQRPAFMEHVVLWSMAEPGRLPLLGRLQPWSDAHLYDLRKALWLYHNGRCEELDRLVADALDSGA